MNAGRPPRISLQDEMMAAEAAGRHTIGSAPCAFKSIWTPNVDCGCRETVAELVRAVLEGEEAEVVTVELDQMVSGPVPKMRNEDGVTIIPVLEEVLVVEKRLVLKREIRIRKRATSGTVEIPVKLRKQRAKVGANRAAPLGRSSHKSSPPSGTRHNQSSYQGNVLLRFPCPWV